MLRLSNQFICTLVLSLVLAGSACAYSGGTGTSGDPYQVHDVNDWQQLMSTSSHWNKYFILTADIDLAGVTVTPVGSSATPFTGLFDGGYHAILNFALHIPSTQPSASAALFGVAGSSAILKNIRVIDPNVSNLGYPGYAAALLGQGLDTTYVLGCSVDGGRISGSTKVTGGLVALLVNNSVNPSSIIGCSATTVIETTGDYCGGLLGYNLHGTVQTSRANCAITTAGVAGGLIAMDKSGTISDSYAIGSVHSTNSIAGGILGINYHTMVIRNCYAAVTVTGGWRAAGLIGDVEVIAGPPSCVNCFWDAELSGLTDGVGRWDPDPTGVTGKTTAEMKMLSTFTGWDFLGDEGGTADTWRMCVSGASYPHLTWEYVKGGDFACPDGVAFDDLARLAADWLLTYSAPLYGADANGDTKVNFADFAMLAADWMH